MNSRTGEYIYPEPNRFISEEEIHTKTDIDIIYIRYYVIFLHNIFVKTISRDKSWFREVYLPKAKLLWNDIEKARLNPNEWNLQNPIKQRTKKINTPKYHIEPSKTSIFAEFDD
jgi:hypothetical protein